MLQYFHLCGRSTLLIEQKFGFSLAQYLAACSLWIHLESWKVSKVLCQSSLLFLAQKKRVVEPVRFFKTFSEWERLFGLTTKFLSKERGMVCLLDTATRAKCSVVLNSVMKHALAGKKPRKITVILNTRSCLLQDLYNGKKKKSLMLWKFLNIHAIKNVRRFLCALILAFKRQIRLEGTSEVSPVKSPLKAGLILKIGQDALFCNP